MKLAIIGQGPRGIQALFALAEIMHTRPDRTLSVTCFDPQPPGYGAAYDIDQEDCLRLNVRPHILDLPGCVSFVDWLTARGASLDDVSRSQVGVYLADMREHLLSHLPDGMTVESQRREVRSLHRVGDGWQLDSGEIFDEVLLAIGHAPPASSAFAGGATTNTVKLIESVYPMREWVDTVTPGSRVIVRGAALTFVDVALTLGQAGRAARVIPTSRSGLLMNTKPVARCSASIEEDLVEQARALLTSDDVLSGPRALALNLLAHISGPEAATDAASDAEYISHILDGESTKPRALSARDRLAHSIVVAENPLYRSESPVREGDVEWALGRAWALLYPDITTALSWHEASPAQWAEFQRQAARYERLTFGPTLPQAKRLLAACDSGFVDTTWLDRRQTLDGIPPTQWGEHADVVINAVLAAPGIVGNDRPLIAGLLAEGAVMQANDGRRGLLVDKSAQCVNTSGQPTPGLSCVGRISEDVVIGHDTLNRHAHPHLRAWAQRLLPPQPPVITQGE